MMNINTVVKRIKRDLGIYSIALPVDNLDGLILDILQDTTLPVFSIYCPREEMIPIDLSYLSQVRRITEDGSELYILPDYSAKKMLYVKRVTYDDSYVRANYIPTWYQLNPMDGLCDLLTATIGRNTGDVLMNSITFHYEHPRKLYIYDALISTKLLITIACEHDNSFQSIPPTAMESFYNLALLDVKAGLYPTIKHYDGLETSFGRIELKLDDWQSAQADRKELISQWDENYLLDAVDYDFN
jgi:hypothetical protein